MSYKKSKIGRFSQGEQIDILFFSRALIQKARCLLLSNIFRKKLTYHIKKSNGLVV